MGRPYPTFRAQKYYLHEVESFFRWLKMHPGLTSAQYVIDNYERGIQGMIKHIFHGGQTFFRYYPEALAPTGALLKNDGSSEAPVWTPELKAWWFDYLTHWQQTTETGWMFDVLTNTQPVDMGGRNDASEGSRDAVTRMLPLIAGYLGHWMPDA